MNKNHPFGNGNKRIAVVALYYFLFKNGRKLKVDNLIFYKFAVKVASSEAIDKDKILVEIKEFIIKHSEKFNYEY